jgi:7-keto-8-aminopelargonate synthetase-like enzyme
MVDEAHATGVFGETGAGSVEDLGISDDVDIILGTFSKALGSFGAYVAVSRDMRDYLINTCRSFIYSTALPHSVIAANMAVLDVVKGEKHRRHELLGNAAFLRKTLREKGFEVRGESQIIPVIIGGNHKAVRLGDALKEKGYWTTPVRPPTVPEGEARLRLSLSFDHGRDVLERFSKDIADVFAQEA